MIEKIIHRIWLGPNSIPPEYEQWWQAWQRQLPSYEFITWNDEQIGRLSLASQIEQADSMAKKADMARYEIAFEYGGTYLDCDIMPLNYYDFAQETADLVVCHETEVPEINCQNAFFSIRKNHPLMALAVKMVSHPDLASQEVIGATGPGFFGRLIRTSQFKRLPTASFYPYLFNEPFAVLKTRDLSKTYGIHVWHNSWFPDVLKLRKINSMLLNGSLSDVEKLWNELGAALQPQAGYIPDYLDRMRRAREQILGVCLQTILSSNVSLKARPEFELLKVCQYLLDRTPDACIWQVGAGDGITDDPLRPVLINYDPMALLVEPNPYLFQELTANYANNKNMYLLNAAIGAQAGSDVLVAVNPSLARAHGMSASTINLSSMSTDNRSALGRMCADSFHKSALLTCMELVNLTVFDFDQLRDMNNGKSPDVLRINIAGMDETLVLAALKSGIRPYIISYGTALMDDQAKGEVRGALGADYEVFDFGDADIACLKSFVIEYCSNLFIESGLPTIFEAAMDVIDRGCSSPSLSGAEA